jgi:hypothetical protein
MHNSYFSSAAIGYAVVSVGLCVWILVAYKKTARDPWWELLVAISATALFWPILGNHHRGAIRAVETMDPSEADEAKVRSSIGRTRTR